MYATFLCVSSSLSERKLDALFMAGFLPKTGNHALISANFGAKVGLLSNEPRSLRQAARLAIMPCESLIASLLFLPVLSVVRGRCHSSRKRQQKAQSYLP